MARRNTRIELDQAALAAEEVVEGLKLCYKKTILPLEKDYKYDLFFDTPMMDVDFEARPMILVLGQYSTGKTTFIKHLIGRDFPGLRIGPEPTTDRFTCVYYGQEDQVIPGPVLQTTPDLPFRPLAQFGNNFLNKFEGAACSSNALKSFTFIDSPGVLSGRKQANRQYPFEEVVEWFASRASRILLMFDGAKLDISDEFKAVIGKLRQHDDKIRVVLNKADSISEKELIRVYGALMWGLGKVFKTPEVPKIYISSFNDKPLNKDNYLYRMFKGDGADLIGELKALPRHGALQKVNMTLKRMRLVKVHSQIMGDLKANIPKFFGKSKKQRQIIDQLPEQFRRIARKIGVPPSDFPSLEKFQKVLRREDLSKYPKLSTRKLRTLDFAMERTIPALVKRLNDRSGGGDSGDNYNPFASDNDSDAVSSLSEEHQPLQELDEKIKDIYARGSYYEEATYERASLGRGSVQNSSVKKAPTRASAMGRTQVPASHQSLVTRQPDMMSERLRHMNGMGANTQSVNGGSQAPPVYAQSMSPTPAHPQGSVSRQSYGRPIDPRTVPYPEPMEEDNRSFYDYRAQAPRQLPRRASNGSNDWVVNMVEKTESDNIFYQQALVNGKLTGKSAKRAFSHLKLPSRTLHRIWLLVDIEKKNELDSDQFALAIWLAKGAINGMAVPEELTWQMIPPSYRAV